MAYDYDPHLLYQAINITVELEYNVPLKVVYKIVEQNEQKPEKLSMQELIILIRSLGKSFQNKIVNREDDVTEEEEELDLKAKIKLMLELLHCELSNEELNQILKGELSIDDALNKQARSAWNLFFLRNEEGKMRPDREMVEQLMLLAQDYALLDINQRYKREMLNQTKEAMREIEMGDYYSKGNIKSERAKKEINISHEEKLILLDKQRRKLKLYLAHMQGYDRDRDHDGGRGINMTTGDIIDLEDIYMADKGIDEYLEQDSPGSKIQTIEPTRKY